MNLEKVKNNVNAASSLLKSLSNKRRLMIVCALYKGEKNVGELEGIIDLSQLALLQHLARLRCDGLVSTRREAQAIYYSLSCVATEEILRCLEFIYA